MLALALVAHVPQAAATPPASIDRRAPQPPQEILDDALAALESNQTVLARRLFDNLIATYPGTAEAGRAALELEVMGTEGSDDDGAVASEGAAKPGATYAPQTFGRDDRLAEVRKEFLLTVGDRVFFAENSAEIGGRSRAVLDHQARWLKARDGLIVSLIGRADDGGSAKDNAALSKARAEAVRDRLVAGGLDANRILVDARGSGDPLALCRSPLCQAQNRHVETVIGDPKQANERSRDAR